MGVRWASNLWDEAAQLEVTFEVWPTCGDGLTLQWTHTRGNSSALLFQKHFASAQGPPHRETVSKAIALKPGDSLFFWVQPHLDHDCDGVYIHSIEVWQSETRQNRSSQMSSAGD